MPAILAKRLWKLAEQNARLNTVEVNFFEADILNLRFFEKKITSHFDVIVSNPPYIKSHERSSMTKQVVDHEPHLALFVKGEDDTIFYKKIIELCTSKLNSGGKLYFELNPLTG